MIAFVPRTMGRPFESGPFKIEMNFPGLILRNPEDRRGLFQLGRFDRATLEPGTFIAMHPHRDDEIFSYVRKGKMLHEDSAGVVETITPTKLMVMNAGAGFYHQEATAEDGETAEVLQIFIRPEEAGLLPTVQIKDFPDQYSLNEWRLLAGPTDAPLTIRAGAFISDMRLSPGKIVVQPKTGFINLLYVYTGSVEIGDDQLKDGDYAIFDESLTFGAVQTSDLVLFELDKSKPYTLDGMYSGYGW